MNRSSLRRCSIPAPSNWRFPGEPNLDSRNANLNLQIATEALEGSVFFDLTPQFWLIWTAVGRTESARQITNEPRSSMQSVKENRTRPLFGVSGEVCSEKAQNELDRVSIVRDVRFAR